MEFQEWPNKLDEVLNEVNELMKTKEKMIKELPCHEYLKFDKSLNLISKGEYCNIMEILLKLFSLDYNQDTLVFFDEEKHKWKTIIGQNRINKNKLSEICYEIHYDDKETAISTSKIFYIIITRQIKSCYRSEFELNPIFMPYEIGLTNIPTIGNFNPPTDLNVNSKYAILDSNYINNYNLFTTIDD